MANTSRDHQLHTRHPHRKDSIVSFRMAYYILHLRDHFNVPETVVLTQMIMNPDIDQIVYLWEHHECEWSNHFKNPQFLQSIKTAVVKVPYHLKDGIAIKLHTLRTVLILQNQEGDPQNIVIIKKTDPKMLCQCICGYFDPTPTLCYPFLPNF